ncbi:MAG: hypothetical protein ACYC8T_26205 [Myxococcaceae bacterium]
MTLRRGETLAWCAAAVAVNALALQWSGGALFVNDSYQYLSTAENLGAGNGLSTSLVHFDIERASGRLPAPVTTFSPGYAVGLAALRHTGLGPVQAGTVLSLLSFMALIPLFAHAAKLLRLGSPATRLGLVWLVANTWGSDLSISILSDSLFTTVAVAAILAFLEAERRAAAGATRYWFIALGSALVGLAYWVRYAGLMLFAAVLLFYALDAALRRTRRALAALAFCGGIAGALIGAGMIRNVLIASTWKGGNTKDVFHPLLGVAKQFVSAMVHLFAGSRVPQRLGPVEVALALAALWAVVLGVRAHRRRDASAHSFGPNPRLPVLLGVCLGVYLAGMTYLGIFSVISFRERMFYPMLPLLVLAMGYLVGSSERVLRALPRRRQLFLGAAVLATCCYVVVNGRSMLAGRELAPHAVVAARLGRPGADGRPLRGWIDAHVPPGAVLVATDAQATGYALKRPAVTLTEAEYSDEAWSSARVQRLMQSFKSDFLILYPAADPAQVPSQRESPLLTALLRGEVPDWLELAAENDEVKIFRRRKVLEAAH